MTQNNPLSKYFRTPGVHIKLPSGGRFNAFDLDELAINGEIPVYPMTAADELLIKNPDALLNGYAVEKLVESCVPAVKSARSLPSQDMDVILLAIKLASYGDDLEVGTKCPHCQNEMEFSLSIQNQILPYVIAMEDEYSVRISDELVAYLRPYDYGCQSKINMTAFEEAKLMQSLLNVESSEEEKLEVFNSSFSRITSLNLDLLSRCIMKIVTPEGEISDYNFIVEFVKKSPKEFVSKILEKMKEFDTTGVRKTTEIKCSECEHEWETVYTFDPSHFFASGS